MKVLLKWKKQNETHYTNHVNSAFLSIGEYTTEECYAQRI